MLLFHLLMNRSKHPRREANEPAKQHSRATKKLWRARFLRAIAPKEWGSEPAFAKTCTSGEVMATKSAAKQTMVTNGQFYNAYKQLRGGEFPTPVFDASELVIEKVLGQIGPKAGPVMLLGKVQSGKTRTFLTSVLLGMDNGFELVIVLTKNSVPLAKQTVSRMKGEFDEVMKHPDVQVGIRVWDVMGLQKGMLPLAQFKGMRVVLVAKKQQNNIQRLIEIVNQQGELAARRCLLVDDEADSVSISYRTSDEAARVASLINDLRDNHPQMAMLQVTATPQSAYLQASDTVLRGNQVMKPLKPVTTVFAPVPPEYVGGEVYFGAESSKHGTLESMLHVPFSEDELTRIASGDRRKVQPDRVLDLPQIEGLRTAIIQFLVGAAILRVNSDAANVHMHPERNHYCMLVHSATSKQEHRFQAEMVEQVALKLREARINGDPVFTQLLKDAYASLSAQVKVSGTAMPSFSSVRRELDDALENQGFRVQIVNSENEVAKMLDESGQIELVCPYTVFVGGSSLDRGVTLNNLIAFYYGRNPRTMQADTVMQHSRMYGYRRKLLGVTRFHTTPQLYDKFKAIEDLDSLMWGLIRSNPDAPVTFLDMPKTGGLVHCAPSHLKPHQVTALVPRSRFLPVGFEIHPLDGKNGCRAAVEALDQFLRPHAADFKAKKVLTLPTQRVLELLELVEQTMFWSPESEGVPWNWSLGAEVLKFAAASNHQVHVWGAFDRRLKRGTGDDIADNPDSKDEADVATIHAIDSPIVMFIGQRGRAADGWSDVPFYWPVVRMHATCRKAVFNDGQKRVSWKNP
jgi:hypothetical protein